MCCCVSCGSHQMESFMARDGVDRLFCLPCFIRFVKKELWLSANPEADSRVPEKPRGLGDE